MKHVVAALVLFVIGFAPCWASGDQEQSASDVSEISILCDPVIWTKQNMDINDSEEMKQWESIAGVNLEYITPPHDQYAEKANLMFASGDLPDVVFLMMEINSQMDIFGKIEDGYFVPVDEYLDSELGQKLLAREDISYWDRWTVDGKRWGIPYIWNLSSNLGTMLRKDWLDNLGMEMPTTLDDYREVLNAFTYDDPDGNGEDDTYGFTFRQDMSWFHTFYGYFGLSEWTNNAAHHVFVVENGEVQYEALLPRYREYVSFIRELYADGVFAPGVLVKNSSDWKADIFGNKAGMWSHQSTRIDSYFMLNMKKANPDWEERGIELAIASPPVNPDTGKGGCPQPYPGDYGLFITQQAEDPEAVFNYIAQTFTSQKAAEFAKYGIEGKQHTVVDGEKQRIDDGDITRYRMLKAVVYTDERFPIDDDDAEFLYGERGLEAYKFNLDNAPISQTTWFGAPTFETEVENPDLKDVVREYTMKMVSGEIELDRGFREMEEKLYQNNLQDVIDERQAWYDANK
jgi:putative aldouronate transport system substrate-binding protein